MKTLNFSKNTWINQQHLVIWLIDGGPSDEPINLSWEQRVKDDTVKKELISDYTVIQHLNGVY